MYVSFSAEWVGTLQVNRQPDPRSTHIAARWSFPAVPRCVGEARSVTRTWAAEHGADVDTEDAIALCVSEAFTNAVVHAFRDRRQPGAVEIEAALRDDAIHISLRDDGIGFRPRVDSPGLGLGMPLMTSLADQIEVGSLARGGTELTLHFALA